MRLASLSRSLRTLSLGVALAGLLIASASPVAAAPVYDSITGNTPTGSVSATLLSWKAAQFVLPAASGSGKYGFGSVVLKLANSPLGTDFAVDIYDSTSSGTAKPHNQVGRLVNPQTTVVGNNTFTPGLFFPELDAGKSYWVVLKGGFDNPAWSTAGNSGVINPSFQQGTSTALTTNAGSTWITSPAASNPYMMQVNAIAVPEPSTWAMGLAGLGFAGVTALRRRRRQG